MNLAQARTDLANALKAWLPDAVSIVDHLPDSITPPVVLVGWSDPWIKPSTLCNFECAMALIVMAQRLEPGGKLETLEEIVAAIVPPMRTLPAYQVVDVTAPFPMQVAGVDYLAATINLTYDAED